MCGVRRVWVSILCLLAPYLNAARVISVPVIIATSDENST